MGARKSGLNVERSDIECPFPSRASKRVNVNIICDYSLDNTRTIHRPAQKSHARGAYVRARVRSVVRFAKKNRFYVPRGEISENWPYKVHTSTRYRNSVLLGPAGEHECTVHSLCVWSFFPRSWRDIRRVGRPSSPSENWLGAVHRSSQDSRGSRVTGQVGRSLRREGEGEERVLSFQFSYIPKYRHLPPPLTPSCYPPPPLSPLFDFLM